MPYSLLRLNSIYYLLREEKEKEKEKEREKERASMLYT